MQTLQTLANISQFEALANGETQPQSQMAVFNEVDMMRPGAGEIGTKAHKMNEAAASLQSEIRRWKESFTPEEIREILAGTSVYGVNITDALEV